MTDKEHIEQIRQRCEKAKEREGPYRAIVGIVKRGSSKNDLEILDFIAHARQDIPDLLRIIADLEKQLENATCDIHTRIGCKVCKEMFRGESLADGTCGKCLQKQLAECKKTTLEEVVKEIKRKSQNVFHMQVADYVQSLAEEQG